MNAWYRELVARARAGPHCRRARSTACCTRSASYEQMLTAEGIVLLKFWIHLSRADQKERLKALDARPEDRAGASPPRTRKALQLYGQFHDTWEHMLRETSIATAPWYVVEGADARYRMLTVGKILLAALRQGERGQQAAAARRGGAPAPSVIGNVAIIRRLDLTQRIDRRRRTSAGWRKHQARLAALTRAPALSRARAGARVRGLRRRRQGRRDPPRHGRARCAAIPDRAGRGAHRGGARAAVPVAVLAARAGEGRHHDLRSHVVRPRAGRARRGFLPRMPTGCAPTTRSTSSRSSWSTPASSCASSGCRSARPSSCGASRRARRRRSSSSRSPGRLAQPPQVGRLRAGGGGHGRPHVD